MFGWVYGIMIWFDNYRFRSLISIRLRMGTRVRVLNIATCSTMDVTGLPSLIVQLIPFYVC